MCNFFFGLTSVSCPFPLRSPYDYRPFQNGCRISDYKKILAGHGHDHGIFLVVQGRFNAPAQPDNQRRKNRYP